MLFVTFLLALTGGLHLPEEDESQRLKLGDRIEVFFESGTSVKGRVISLPDSAGKRVTTVSFRRQGQIVLDISAEYPGLWGTMSIRTKAIKSIHVLQYHLKDSSERSLVH